MAVMLYGTRTYGVDATLSSEMFVCQRGEKEVGLTAKYLQWWSEDRRDYITRKNKEKATSL
jgi:hypothetical protein